MTQLEFRLPAVTDMRQARCVRMSPGRERQALAAMLVLWRIHRAKRPDGRKGGWSLADLCYYGDMTRGDARTALSQLVADGRIERYFYRDELRWRLTTIERRRR